MLAVRMTWGDYACRMRGTVLALVLTLPLVIGAGVTQTADIELLLIDGTSFKAEWIGSKDGKTLKVKSGADLRAIRWDEIDRITMIDVPDAESEDAASEDQPADDTPEFAVDATFYLADGGRLLGELMGDSPKNEQVLSRSILGSKVPLAYADLAAIRFADTEAFPKSEQLFAMALASRRSGEDVLITRSRDQPRSLPGRLDQLNPQRGTFVFSKRERTFQIEKVYGIVFAAGLQSPRSTLFNTTLEFIDGAMLSGRLESADVKSVTLASSIGQRSVVRLQDISSIRVYSRRIVYLSELTPVSTEVRGLLHRPWPIRIDQSVSGAPMSIAGRRFNKGLGVHSYTALMYDIEGLYQRFVATIGVDDAVGPRGSLVFRVLCDDKTVFESSELTGQDDPVELNVDVTGVHRLELVVDYGEQLDLSDHADWAAPRLLKAAGK